jgi:hypothetical protein
LRKRSADVCNIVNNVINNAKNNGTSIVKESEIVGIPPQTVYNYMYRYRDEYPSIKNFRVKNNTDVKTTVEASSNSKLKRNYQRYSDEFKTAVIDNLAITKSISCTADKFNISRETVTSWVRSMDTRLAKEVIGNINRSVFRYDISLLKNIVYDRFENKYSLNALVLKYGLGKSKITSILSTYTRKRLHIIDDVQKIDTSIKEQTVNSIREDIAEAGIQTTITVLKNLQSNIDLLLKMMQK